jgi:hypothetical protein
LVIDPLPLVSICENRFCASWLDGSAPDVLGQPWAWKPIICAPIWSLNGRLGRFWLNCCSVTLPVLLGSRSA